MTVVVFLLILGLCARLTRLLVVDSITQPVRDWFLKHTNPGGELKAVTEVDGRFGQRQTTTQTSWVDNPRKFSHRAAKFMWELLDCPWCTSVHVVFWALLATNTTGHTHLTAWAFAAVWGTLAYLVGLVCSITGALHNYENREW